MHNQIERTIKILVVYLQLSELTITKKIIRPISGFLERTGVEKRAI